MTLVLEIALGVALGLLIFHHWQSVVKAVGLLLINGLFWGGLAAAGYEVWKHPHLLGILAFLAVLIGLGRLVYNARRFRAAILVVLLSVLVSCFGALAVWATGEMSWVLALVFTGQLFLIWIWLVSGRDESSRQLEAQRPTLHQGTKTVTLDGVFKKLI